MRILAALLCVAMISPAFAGGTKNDYVVTRDGGSFGGQGRSTGTGRRQDPVERFVESNLAETLYHELGHALIDVLDLPVFGPEEFAVDLFAIVMINRMRDEETAVQMAFDIAAAYDAGAMKESTAGNGPAMWDVHGSDRQRYFNLVCHMYGANPYGRDRLAKELGLPDARAETCQDEYSLTSHAWGGVIDRMIASGPGRSLVLDATVTGRSHPEVFIAAEVARINNMMSLPARVRVTVEACDQVNAFYDPGELQIIICTEMGEHLAGLVR